MTQPPSSYSELLREARSLLREEEICTARENIVRLARETLADPMLLYPSDGYRPRFVVWELTLRCNMHCRHCGSDAGTRRGHELEPAEALDLCDQLAALGCERLTLLGGEPFLREDWEAITARLQAGGVRVNVITNGWLTGERSLVQRIKDAGLTTFAISVDGVGPRHDELRCRDGSFARNLQSFDHAVALGGLSVAAVTTITRQVVDQLEELYAILLDHGVRLWQLQVCTPQGRMRRDDPVLPTPEDLRTVADFIVAKKQEGRMRLDPADNVGYYGPWELDHGFRSSQRGRVNFWSGCQAGCQVMGIDANGDIKGCLSQPSSQREFVEGNVREEPLATIWHRPGGFAYNRAFTFEMLEGYCRKCEYRGLCRAGCISHAVCTTGSRGDNPTCLHRLIQEGRLPG